MIVVPLGYRFSNYKQDAPDLTSLLLEVITRFGILPNHVMGFNSDGCATNRGTVSGFGVVYECALDSICIMHRMNCSMDYIGQVEAKNFWAPYATLSSKSDDFRLAVDVHLGKTLQSYSSVRWLSRLKVLQQALGFMMAGDFNRLRAESDLSSGSWQTVIDIIITNQTRFVNLKAELCAQVDIGNELKDMVYQFEGDEPMIFEAYKILNKIKS